MYVKPSYKVADWLTIGGIFETGFNNFNDKKVVPIVGGGLFTEPGLAMPITISTQATP